MSTISTERFQSVYHPLYFKKYMRAKINGDAKRKTTFPIQYIKHTLQLENSLSNIKIWIYTISIIILQTNRNIAKADTTQIVFPNRISPTTRYNESSQLTQRQHHFVKWQSTQQRRNNNRQGFTFVRQNGILAEGEERPPPASLKNKLNQFRGNDDCCCSFPSVK